MIGAKPHRQARETQWDFPGGPVVKSSAGAPTAQFPSLVGELTSHMLCGQKPKHRKQKQDCQKFNKDRLKMVHIKKFF